MRETAVKYCKMFAISAYFLVGQKSNAGCGLAILGKVAVTCYVWHMTSFDLDVQIVKGKKIGKNYVYNLYT